MGLHRHHLGSGLIATAMLIAASVAAAQLSNAQPTGAVTKQSGKKLGDKKGVAVKKQDMQKIDPTTKHHLQGPTITVAGYGHYCSMTWKTGGWTFTSDPNGNDPCRWAMERTDPGGTIERAGIYDANGVNTVIARCADGTVWLHAGIGNDPLTRAFHSAEGRPGCVFTVAPRDLPIFDNPFKSPDPSRTNNGFDFARPPYETLNVADFGHSGPPKGIDPWGWLAYPDGALSVTLWKKDEAPSLSNWGP